MRISAIMLILLLSMQLNAQHYTRDAGARAGAYPALCYRQYTDDFSYSEVMVSLNRTALRVTYLKEYARPAMQGFSPDLVFIYGFGAHSGFNRINQYRVLSRTYFYDHYRYSPLLGLDGYLGFEYRFPHLPVIVGIDAKPFFEFSTNQFFGLHLFDTSLLLKIKF
jgi:hypothetical protein